MAPEPEVDEFAPYADMLEEGVIPEFGVRIVVGLHSKDNQQYFESRIDGESDENSIIGVLDRTKFLFLLGATLTPPDDDETEPEEIDEL